MVAHLMKRIVSNAVQEIHVLVISSCILRTTARNSYRIGGLSVLWCGVFMLLCCWPSTSLLEV